jgi:sugar O-acyltransferase (sialic acid O-acetyltransferase NeuD family)
MKPKLLIVGAGGHGLVVADTALEQGSWSEIAFLDDEVKGGLLISSCKVVGVTADASSLLHQYQDLFVAIGDNKRRIQLIKERMSDGFSVPYIVHPSSVICAGTAIGVGSFVAANSVVGVGVKLGKGCIINTGATVDHESVLSDGVHVSPGAHLGGGVRVGSCTWIGIGASVREQITIGNDVVVGAGAAVVSNVDDKQQMLGVPACKKGS